MYFWLDKCFVFCHISKSVITNVYALDEFTQTNKRMEQTIFSENNTFQQMECTWKMRRCITITKYKIFIFNDALFYTLWHDVFVSVLLFSLAIFSWLSCLNMISLVHVSRKCTTKKGGHLKFIFWIESSVNKTNTIKWKWNRKHIRCCCCRRWIKKIQIQSCRCDLLMQMMRIYL